MKNKNVRNIFFNLSTLRYKGIFVYFNSEKRSHVGQRHEKEASTSLYFLKLLTNY